MSDLVKSIRRELRFVLHTPAVLIVLLVAPLTYPFLYNYLYVNKFETKLPVAIADFDRSAKSRELIRLLDATEQLSITQTDADISAARPMIEQGTIAGYLVIPKEYERDLLKGKRPVLRAYINATRIMPDIDVGKGISEAIGGLGRELQIEKFCASGVSVPVAKRWSQPIVLRSEGIANTIESYGDFIIPSLLLMILQQSLFAATAAASAGRRRRSLAPAAWLVGRAIPYLILYAIYALTFFTFQYRIWKIPFSGSSVALAALTAIEFASIVATGFLIGSFFKSRPAAFLMAMFSSYPFFLLSGMAWPVESLPPLLRVVSHALPATWYFPAALSLSRLDATWANALPQTCVLAAIGATVAAILYVRTRRSP